MSVSQQNGAAGGEEFERDSEDVAADVYDFVADYLDDQASGSVRPLHEYLARYSGAEEEVAAEYLRLTGHSVDDEAGAGAESSEDDGERHIGRYRLVRLLGRGGQGEVWLAEDERLGREVAIKLLTALFVTEDRRSRFRREAESIARLEHAGLAHVHEADIDGDVPYIAMRYVPGIDLGSSLQEARARAATPGPGIAPLVPWIPRTRGELTRVLRFFERCARALHAAHDAGVLHRDVKPGNIMVTPEGEPVLLDFGLAREEVADGDAALTREGDLFGTLAYMAPEQLRGSASEIDARADVWALGVTLFEALTGERPFEGGGPGELAIAIDSGRRKDVHALNPHLSTDVRVVLDSALERSRERRYPDALALAEDLRRIREYEPIRARPAGPILRLRRWCRREPAWAAALAVTLVALAGLVVLKQDQLREKQDQLVQTRRLLDSSMAKHFSAEVPGYMAKAPAGALAVGLAAVEMEDHWRNRSVLYPPLLALTLSRQFTLPERPVWDAVFADERTLVACGTGGAVRAFDRLDAVERGAADVGGDARTIALDTERDRILVGTSDGRLVALEADGLDVVWEVELADEMIHDLVVGAFGGAALVGASSIVAFDPASGARGARLDADPASLGELCLSSSGDRIVATGRASHGLPATRSTTALLLGLPSLEVVAELPHAAPLRGASIADAADLVATIDEGGVARAFDLRTGASVPIENTGGDHGPGSRPAAGIQVGETGTSVAIDSSATRLVVGVERGGTPEVVAFVLSRAGTDLRAAHLWSSTAERRVVDLVLSPDETCVACASWDSRVRVVDVDSGALRMEHAERNRPSNVVWSPSGEALASHGIAWTIEVWRTSSSAAAFRLEALDGATDALVWGAFTSDAERIVALDAAGRAGVYEAPLPGSDTRVVPGVLVGRVDPGGASDAHARVAVAADATVAVWVGSDGAMRLVDTSQMLVLDETRVALEPFADDAPRQSVAIAPDGAAVVVVGGDGAAWIWRRGEGPRPIERPHRADGSTDAVRFQVVAFGSPGDALLADDTGSVTSVAVDAIDSPWRFEAVRAPGTTSTPRSASAIGIAISPDGSEVVVASYRDRLQCWSTRTGKRTRNPRGRVNRRWVQYFDDGRILSAAAGAGTACVIDEDSVARQIVPHDDRITSCAAGPRGEVFVTGSLDGTVFVWDAASVDALVRAAVHDGPVRWVATAPGPDRGRVLSCADDGGAVWPVDVLAAARRAAPRGLFTYEVKDLKALVGAE